MLKSVQYARPHSYTAASDAEFRAQMAREMRAAKADTQIIYWWVGACWAGAIAFLALTLAA